MNKATILIGLLVMLTIAVAYAGVSADDVVPTPGASAQQVGADGSVDASQANQLSQDKTAAQTTSAQRIAAETGPTREEKLKRHRLRVMTKAEFLQRLIELGVDPSSSLFSSIGSQRSDRGSLMVLTSSNKRTPVNRAKVMIEPVSQETLRHHVGNGNYSKKAQSRTTRRDGIALFVNLMPQHYMIGAHHPGYLSSVRAGVDVAIGAPTFVEIMLQAPDSLIAGVVRDERGGAIADVMLRARRYTEGGAPFTAVGNSNVNGSFRLGVQSGTQSTVTAKKTGYQDTRIDGVLAGVDDLVVTMRPTPTVAVSGYVTNGTTGEPITSFMVDGQPLLHSAGMFRVIRNVSPEPQTLTFAAFGVEPRAITVTLAEEQDVDLGEVQLYGARELNGIVLMSAGEGMEPVRGATVTVTTDDGQIASQLSTEAGAFAFKQLAANQVQLAVTAVGMEPYNNVIALLPEEPTYIEVVLSNGEFEASGVITDEDTSEPLAEVLVEVTERPGLQAMSDAAGAYQITGIDLPEFTLRASKAGYRPKQSPLLTGVEGGTTWDGQLIGSGLRIKFSRLGAPLPGGVTVSLWRRIASATTAGIALGAQGNLAANRLVQQTEPDGSVTFDVEDGDYYVQVVDYRLHPMLVVADEANTEWLEIALPGRTHLTGHVLQANGAPLANTSFWLHSGDQDYSTMFLYHTDAAGGFAIPNLAQRPYALSIIKGPTVQSAQHVVEFQGLGAASQSLNITLPTMTASIHGRVTDANGNGKGGVQVGVEYLNAPHRSILAGWVLTGPDGTYNVPLLEAGNHRVRTAWTNEVAAYSDIVTVTPASNIQVDLVMPTTIGHRITGHMIAADGGPLGGNFQFAVDSQGRQNGNFMSSMDWGYVGPFEIKGLASGTHTIVLTAMGCLQQSVTVNVGSNINNLVVVMQRQQQ